MEKKLKLSDKLSFRGWPQECVAELLKLERDNAELLAKNEVLENALRRSVRAHAATAKAYGRQVRNDSQSFSKPSRKKP